MAPGAAIIFIAAHRGYVAENGLPSGYLTVCHGKIHPFLIGKLR